LFKKWGWSFKVPDRRAQLQKFTWDNIRYYCDFTLQILDIPLVKCKFLDEATYNSKDLNRRRVIGPANTRQHITNKTSISATYTVTLMTSVDPNTPPVMIDVREGTNSGIDFLNFVTNMLEQGWLSDGDFLFVDNAKIHRSAQHLFVLSNLLEAHGVHLIYYLPTYSPELNPAEICWAFSKNFLRKYRNPKMAFDEEIVHSLARITHFLIWKWYQKCRDSPFNDGDSSDE